VAHSDNAVWDSAMTSRLVGRVRWAERWIDSAQRQVDGGIWIPAPRSGRWPCG
jgi:hypothetical protein